MSKIYVVQVAAAEEIKVRARLARNGIAAYVPARELIVRRSGGWTKETKLLFPSYVFIECDYSPEIHHIVKSTDGVLKWLGRPTPITGEEEQFMRLMFNGGLPIPESTATVDSSRQVTVTGGWLLENTKYIKGYNIRKKKALLDIYFSGRTHHTSVSVEFTKA